MAPIGFVVMAASGFASVLQAAEVVPAFIVSVTHDMPNKEIAVLLLLVTGLLITMGIGSSFSTILIIATVYIPIAIQMELSPMAIAALLGTSGVLEDTGSPSSDSTLGPTTGLAIDEQHDPMYGTVIPTFIHYNTFLYNLWLDCCDIALTICFMDECYVDARRNNGNVIGLFTYLGLKMNTH